MGLGKLGKDISDTVKKAGGDISDTWKKAGGDISDTWKKAGGDISDEVKRALAGDAPAPFLDSQFPSTLLVPPWIAKPLGKLFWKLMIWMISGRGPANGNFDADGNYIGPGPGEATKAFEGDVYVDEEVSRTAAINYYNRIGAPKESKKRAISLWDTFNVNIIPLLDELLIRGGDDKVYVIEGGQRRLITDQATFNKLGYRPDDVIDVPKSIVSQIGEGSAIKAKTKSKGGSGGGGKPGKVGPSYVSEL